MKAFIGYLAFTVAILAFLRLLRGIRSDLSVLSSLATVLFLSGVSLALIVPIVDYVNYLAIQYSIDHIGVLWKGLAVTFLTSTVADLCRSGEEAAVAEKIELLGKCELLLLSLPLLKTLGDLVIVLARG